MTRKCHNHKPQEKTQRANCQMTARRQLKESSQLSLPQRNDYKTRKDTIIYYVLHNKTWTNHKTPTHNESNNKQQNHHRTNRNDFNAFHWGRILVLDSVFKHKLFLPNLCNVSSQRNNLTYMMKQRK